MLYVWRMEHRNGGQVRKRGVSSARHRLKNQHLDQQSKLQTPRSTISRSVGMRMEVLVGYCTLEVLSYKRILMLSHTIILGGFFVHWPNKCSHSLIVMFRNLLQNDFVLFAMMPMAYLDFLRFKSVFKTFVAVLLSRRALAVTFSALCSYSSTFSYLSNIMCTQTTHTIVQKWLALSVHYSCNISRCSKESPCFLRSDTSTSNPNHWEWHIIAITTQIRFDNRECLFNWVQIRWIWREKHQFAA
jgi:hypothetical protein